MYLYSTPLFPHSPIRLVYAQSHEQRHLVPLPIKMLLVVRELLVMMLLFLLILDLHIILDCSHTPLAALTAQIPTHRQLSPIRSPALISYLTPLDAVVYHNIVRRPWWVACSRIRTRRGSDMYWPLRAGTSVSDPVVSPAALDPFVTVFEKIGKIFPDVQLMDREFLLVVVKLGIQVLDRMHVEAIHVALLHIVSARYRLGIMKVLEKGSDRNQDKRTFRFPSCVNSLPHSGLPESDMRQLNGLIPE